MLVNELYKINDTDFIKTYSDLSVYIRKIKLVGPEELYAEARYPARLSSTRQYEETDISIVLSSDLSANA